MRNLLEFLSKYYHWLLFLVLEVVSFVLLFQYNSYQGSVWFSTSNAVVGKVYEVDAAIESFFSLTMVNENLTQRNFYLERQVNQLRRLYADMTRDTTAAERAELEFLGRYELIPAKVVSNSIDRADNLMTIDRGRKDGVEVDMGVACGNGVVGVVYLVSDHYSVVMPVLNYHSRISCSIRHRGYFGYLKWSGGDASIAYVEDVPRHAKFKRGDWVETSGYSSIFPPGVLVGKIVEVYNSRDGLSYKLKVHLSTDFGNVRDVCVISDKGIAERTRLMEAARDSMRQGNKE
ncbi:MAG: rod shape-determining protein MreC [Prevotella sp.]|nr:rod shape-determining protein MreC [Prevotella sp.]